MGGSAKQNTETPSSHQWMGSVTAAYKGLRCLRTEPAPFLQGCELPAALAEQQGAVLSGASWPEAQPPAQMAPDLNLI